MRPGGGTVSGGASRGLLQKSRAGTASLDFKATTAQQTGGGSGSCCRRRQERASSGGGDRVGDHVTSELALTSGRHQDYGTGLGNLNGGTGTGTGTGSGSGSGECARGGRE
jgi:hypothetical protein